MSTADLVEAVVARGDGFAAYVLEMRGGHAVRALTKACADPRVVRDDSPPLRRIWQVLRPHRPLALVPSMLRHLEMAGGEGLSMVIQVLTELATPEALDAVRAAVRSPDAERRRLAVLGAHGGMLSAPRRDAWIVDAVLQEMDRWVDTLEGFKCEGAAHSMLRLDASQAAPMLTTPSRFHIASPKFGAILGAFERARVPLPHEHVLALVPVAEEWLRQGVAGINERGRAVVVSALPVMARGLPAEAMPIVSKALTSTNPSIRAGAGRAWAVLHGVEDAYAVVLDQLHKLGNEREMVRLSRPRRVYWTCYSVDEQVCNGGFDQFFFNPSGVHARFAPEALVEIGAPRRAELMRKALDAIGPDQVAAAEHTYVNVSEVPSVREALSALTGEYYALDTEAVEEVLFLLELHAAKHQSEFRFAQCEQGRR